MTAGSRALPFVTDRQGILDNLSWRDLLGRTDLRYQYWLRTDHRTSDIIHRRRRAVAEGGGRLKCRAVCSTSIHRDTHSSFTAGAISG